MIMLDFRVSFGKPDGLRNINFRSRKTVCLFGATRESCHEVRCLLVEVLVLLLVIPVDNRASVCQSYYCIVIRRCATVGVFLGDCLGHNHVAPSSSVLAGL